MIDGLAEILAVLSRNRLRTLLTALSVAWGTFVLALLLGAGRGLRTGVAWEFRDDAVAAVWIHGGQTSVPFAGRAPGRSVYFTHGDYDAIGREIRGAEHRTGRYYLWGEFQVSRGARHAAFDIRGVHPGHRYLERTELVRGRFLNDADLAERRKVAVIGTQVTEALFGGEDPVGARIAIRGSSYLIVGEFADVGGEAELRRIYVPITTAQLVYGQPDIIHGLAFTLASEDLAASREASAATRALLGRRHAVAPEDRRALRVHNNLEEFRRMTEVFTWVDVFVWVVALGTLFAGIVGVGNIMLIAVAERTREIGVRKAVGATSASIVGMIVTEAVLITALSGYAGLVAGVTVVELVAGSGLDLGLLREPAVDVRLGLIASALLVGAGALAGLFPALRAARVDPIVALREGG